MSINKNFHREWLALFSLPNVGPATAKKWLEHVGSPCHLFSSSPQLLRSLGISAAHIKSILFPEWARVDAILDWLLEKKCTLLTRDDKAYPEILTQLSAPPIVLFLQGNVELLSTPQLAIVGSRKPTKTAEEIAQTFAQELSQAGFTITSGLARGIDAASHRGALKAKGKTVAVLGTGLDIIYPNIHRILSEEILQEGGTVVTEFPPGTPARPENFPRRNRIISGLSQGVIVVEAALHSGSLITARYGLEQGREIFAVPGSIYNPLNRGCHALIKEGAKLVENCDDILEELIPLNIKKNFSPSLTEENSGLPFTDKGLDSEGKILVECLGFEVTPVDVLIQRSQLTPESVIINLLKLELEGWIEAMPGGYLRKRKV